jgi:outer membrane protein OmpA-like peptidoglycan-associated protein
MNATHPTNRTRLLTAVFCIGVLLPFTAVRAQNVPAGAPMAAPAEAPKSRLTITPAEFERWLAGRPVPTNDMAGARDSEPAMPSLVTPPPPTPILVAPPLPPVIAPSPVTPAAATPATSAPVLEPPATPQTATLPPKLPDTTPSTPESAKRPDTVKVLYAAGAEELPEAAKADLENLASWLRQNPKARVQILSYASGPDSAGAQARRTSLGRGLAVRDFLVENGVLSTRMHIRALGAKTEELPLDRVEVSVPPS